MSFAAAIDAGADVLELDLRASQDGQLVAVHDDSLLRIAGVDSKVGSLPLAALQEVPLLHTDRQGTQSLSTARIASFVDILRTFPHAHLNVDIKIVGSRYVAQALREIRAARRGVANPGRVLLTSSSARNVHAIRAHNQAEVLCGASAADILHMLASVHLPLVSVSLLGGRVLQLPLQISVLGMRVPVVTDAFLRRAKALGCAVHVWLDDVHMVDTPALAQYLFARGVQGVFTNDIRCMVEASRAM